MRKVLLITLALLVSPHICFAQLAQYITSGPTAISITYLSDKNDDDLRVDFKIAGAAAGAARGPIAITTTCHEGIVTGYKYCSMSTDFDMLIREEITDMEYSSGELLRCVGMNRSYSVDKTGIQKQFNDADGVFQAWFNDDASVSTPTVTGYFYIKKAK
jgi:hypothetical protein